MTHETQAGNHRRSARTVAPFFAVMVIVLGLLATAQSHALIYFQASSQPKSSPQKTGSNKSGQSPSRSMTRQLVEESREAAGEDDQAQFKHSSSVQFISKLTGLDLEHSYWLAVVLNFAVIALAIIWLWKKNLPAVFKNRTASIQKAMQEARKASEEANRRLADIEARLSKLDVEINAMRAAAEQEAAAEEVRIKAAAEEDARKIVESAGQEIAAAAKSARRELTAYGADLAVSLARKQIRVDAATDESLIRNFAQQLSANGGESQKGKQ
jgi:F-type H+-transporting ATPase subunit b